MKINLHAGHNPDGKVASGASKLIKESTEARLITGMVIKQLRKLGHTVYDCTCNNGKSQSDVLRKIVTKCNEHDVDIDVSIHFNSGANDTKGNGKTTGTEVFIYKNNSKAKPYAQKIVNNIADLGFKLRDDAIKDDVKTNENLYVLKNTNAPCLLLEVCFVDDKDDVALYQKNKEQIALAITYGITGNEFKDYDINKDGRVDAEDALEILKQKAGMTPKTGDYDAEDALEILKGVASVSSTKSESFGKINGTGVRIRKGPGTNYGIIEIPKDGTLVRIWKEQNGWYQIDTYKWVSAKYVELI